MAQKIIRAGTPPNAKNMIDVGTTVEASETLNLTQYAWGTIKFPVHLSHPGPGTVTVYARLNEDDDWAIAQNDLEPPEDITFTVTAGQPRIIPPEVFFYCEVRFVGEVAYEDVPVGMKT